MPAIAILSLTASIFWLESGDPGETFPMVISVKGFSTLAGDAVGRGVGVHDDVGKR